MRQLPMEMPSWAKEAKDKVKVMINRLSFFIRKKFWAVKIINIEE